VKPSRGLPTIAWKEIRALLPVWAGCVIVALLVLVLPLDHRTSDWAIVGRIVSSFAFYVFFLTPIVLGALSMGHEFAHGTWPLLLSQPMARPRVLAVKMGVLASLIATAGVPALFALRRMNPRGWAELVDAPVADLVLHPGFSIPLAGGLLLAPWFTLVSRSAVGGMVAAFVAPGLVYAVGLVLARLVFGSDPGSDPVLAVSSEGFIQAAWRWGMAGLAAAAAWGGVRSFGGAEVTERLSSATINAWRISRRAPSVRSRRRHASPVRLLLAKEFRLQVPTLAVAGLFVLIWCLTLTIRGRMPQLFSVYQSLFGMVIALLAGAVISAEERQFGTIESQLLLPMAVWQQWVFKVGVAIGTVAALSIGLNLFLAIVSPGDVRAHLRSQDYDWVAVGLAGFTVAAVYVSSVTRGGLRALILAGAGAVAMVLLVTLGSNVLQWLTSEIPGLRPIPWRRFGTGMSNALVAVQVVIGIVAALMALRYAFVNHRFSDIGPRRIGAQVATMYVWLVGSLTLAQVVLVRIWR
jgi:hypothetical protein